MGLNLIGTEDKNLYQCDGVYLSADMTNYNSSGELISHKLLEYGPYSAAGDYGGPGEIVMYGKDMVEYDNPVFDSIGIGAYYPYTGKHLTVFTFDDYRQHSWATDTLTASGNGTYFNDRLERNNVCMSISMTINDISGYNARFGIADAHVPYGRYTAKVKSINGSTLTFDNRYWQIVNPHIGAAHVSAMTGWLQDIWYDTNVIECPADSPSGYQGYRLINTHGFYKNNSTSPNRAFYYNEPKNFQNELRKVTMKWIINHTDNTIIICDKFNGSYRPLISGTFPDYYDMKNFRNLCIEFGSEASNAWGVAARFSRIVKNLKMYKLNCPIDLAIQYEPPEEKPIYKDNITQWEDFSITKETPVVAMRPGDTTLHTSNTLLDKAGMEALCPGSAFSGTGYYVYKATWDRHTNYSGRVPKTYFCGNMASGSYDNYVSGAVLPNALIDTSATGNYNVLLNGFIQSGSSTTEYPLAESGTRPYAQVDNAWIGNYNYKLRYFYKNKLKNEDISAKYILYNVSGNYNRKYYTRVEYCEYIPECSSYIPICYIQAEKGYIRTTPNVIDNTNLYFSYVREPMSWSSYEKGQQLWVRNSEFFHTSSYYDALYG